VPVGAARPLSLETQALAVPVVVKSLLLLLARPPNAAVRVQLPSPTGAQHLQADEDLLLLDHRDHLSILVVDRLLAHLQVTDRRDLILKCRSMAVARLLGPVSILAVHLPAKEAPHLRGLQADTIPEGRRRQVHQEDQATTHDGVRLRDKWEDLRPQDQINSGKVRLLHRTAGPFEDSEGCEVGVNMKGERRKLNRRMDRVEVVRWIS